MFRLIAAFLVPSMQRLFAAPLDAALRDDFDQGNLPELHGAIIDLGSQRLAEVYFSGRDERWGQSLGERTLGPTDLHDLRSVTKSVVGLLYGIALAEGKVPAPDQPLYAQFPDYADLAAQPGRDRILIAHALSMQMGLEWNEDLPYSDPRNSEIAMEHAPDRFRFALKQPIREAPGELWIYSGGAVALVGKLIADGTGMPLDDYAREKLFDPLGITQFEWIAGADGVPSAASGLRLTLPDLVKIGHLVAQDGIYDGQQVVPVDWLAQSFRPQVRVNEVTQYGYLWYLAGQEVPAAIAVGNGGQRLTIYPDVDLVVANVAGRYNDPESWHGSVRLVHEFAFPEARRLLGR